jgi:hypothetical protein
MINEIEETAADRLARLEALAERNETERLTAETAENQKAWLRAQSLKSLSKQAVESEERHAEAAAERRQALEDRGRRHDAHLRSVQPQIDKLVGRRIKLDAAEEAERSRLAGELTDVLAPLTREKLEIGREIARLQTPPAGPEPETVTPRARLRALVGRAA